jgi:ABC-2 type transport system ATP-binding protein
VIEATALTKRYGNTVAVDGLSFRVCPGRVTGFLGPNGAGKSTTMRMILGLDRPSGGAVTVNGMPYQKLAAPLHQVGSMLDSTAVHGGRSAFHHLLWLAHSNGIGRARIREVLEMAGLSAVAGKRVKGFSLGMAQRLGIAAALLGDPGVLILDEPVNGLDTEGIRWIRGLLKRLAADGRTVLLSSHLMSEMELTADHLIVIGRGRLIANAPMREFIERNSQAVTVVRSPQPGRLAAALRAYGARIDADRSGRWRVTGPDAAMIGDIAAARGVAVHELTPQFSTLEDVYTRMTRDTVEFQAQPAGAGLRDEAADNGA